MVNFLKKLQEMVTDDKYSNVIRWQDGAILIISPQGLIDNVLEKYFRHNNYTSFQRQLNYFGFKKVAGGRNKNSAAVYVNSELDKQPAAAILTCTKRSGRAPGIASAAADGGHHRHRQLLRQQSASAPELLGKRTERGAPAVLRRATSTDAGSYDGYSSNNDQDYGSEEDEEDEDAEMGYYEAAPAAASRSHRAAAAAADIVTAAAAAILPRTISRGAGSTLFGALSSGGTGAAESYRGTAEYSEELGEPVESANSPDMPAPTTELCFPSDFKNPKAAAAAMADACTEAEQAAAKHGASELFQPRRGGRGSGGSSGMALSLNIRPDGLASSFSSYCAAPHGGRALLTPRGLSIRAPRTPRSPGAHRTPRTPVPVSREGREDGNGWPTDSRFPDMLPLPGADFLGADAQGAPYPSPFDASLPLPPQGAAKWEEQSYNPAADGGGSGGLSPM